MLTGGQAQPGLPGVLRSMLAPDVQLLLVSADLSAPTTVTGSPSARLMNLRTLDELPRAIVAAAPGSCNDHRGAPGGERGPGPGVGASASRDPGSGAAPADASRAAGLILLDVVVVLALTGFALIGLATTFVSWQYLVVGMVAAGTGRLLSLLTMRMPLVRAGGAVYHSWYRASATRVALRDEGLGGGIPDLRTLADVMQGCARAGSSCCSTLPFVDVAGPPALVPYLLGFLGSVTVAGRPGRAHP